jgi:phosphatidylserine/phosphatidylglycerophosphate/cardiolipin synthase-like enzyme
LFILQLNRLILHSYVFSGLTLAAVAAVAPPWQPLDSIVTSTTVELIGEKGTSAEGPGDILTSIKSLDALIHTLSNVNASRLGISPGFDTVESEAIWRTLDAFPEYQTLDSANFFTGTIPMPCTEIAMKYFLRIKDVWRERLDWACSEKEVCSCISKWQHRQTANILLSLANQIIEQLMVQEANACLRNQPNLGNIWSECYTPEKCPSPDEMSSLYLDSTVQLLDNLEDYIYSYVDCALKARHTIDISICYLFYIDPAARYILLDLIPFVAARGVKVRILFESMTVESQVLRGVFAIGESFDYKLPEGSPPFHNAQKRTSNGASRLIRQVLDIASSSPNIDCRFWFARDERCKYRIKNHIKCNIFDGNLNGRVIAGGSNVAPRPGNLDTDFIVQGDIAGSYLRHFDIMWNAMSPYYGGVIDSVSTEEKKEVDESPTFIFYPNVVEDFSGLSDEKKKVDEILPLDNEFSTEETYQRYGMSSKILFLPSVPSSLGEDVILRCVLGGIKQAKESIFICMGHCNVPEVVSEALKEATERGVTVEILTNSLYSCDLRCGQRDLFKSLQLMLQIAPMVDLVSACKVST